MPADSPAPSALTPAPEPQTRCGDMLDGWATCALAKGHRGPHEDATGETGWDNDSWTSSALPAPAPEPPREWTGVWNNWIAPFHACPRCGASLNWTQGEDALERPLISASHCGVHFSARMTWRAE